MKFAFQLNRIPWQLKLVALMLLMAILPSLIISYSVTDLILNELKGNINEKLIFSSNSVSSSINSKINTSLEIQDLIKNTIENPNINANEKIEFMVSNIKKIHNIISLSLYIDEGGVYNQALFAGKDFLRREDNQVIPVDSSQEKINLSKLNINEQQFPFITTPVYNNVLGTWICWVISGVNLPKMPPAYLVSQLDLYDIASDLKNHLLNRMGTLFVTDSSGKKFLTNKFLVQLPDKIISDAQSLAENKNKIALVNNYSDPEFGDFVTSFSPTGAVKWVVVSIISKNSAYAVVNKAFIFFLIFAVVSIILSIIAAFLFSRHLSRPIIKMAQTSHLISGGNFDISADYKANDSIGLLSKSLSKMGKQLKKNFNEIADQKEQLVEYSKNLEKKVEERTSELSESNSELKKAYRRVLELGEEKDEFLAIAAHDLKNPLIAISTFADTLNHDKALSSTQHYEFLNEIIRTSNRMSMIVKNLLDINTIEQGKLNVKLEKVPIISLITEFKNQNLESILQKNLSLIENYNNEEADALADNNLTFQIIQNILSNAIKFSPQNKNIFISIQLSKNREMIELRIKDEGLGFSEEDKKKVFQKFARLSAQPIGGGFSTGLGLSIVKKLVELMNGSITLESEKGNGAEFIILLPKYEETKKIV